MARQTCWVCFGVGIIYNDYPDGTYESHTCGICNGAGSYEKKEK